MRQTCPHCGFTYDDETGEIHELNKLIKETAGPVFKQLDAIRGYRPPKRAAEAASILRMLKKFSPDQIIETWRKLKSDKFYQDKELYMMTVETQIGAIVASSQHQSDGYIINPKKFNNQSVAICQGVCSNCNNPGVFKTCNQKFGSVMQR